jgi:hypothetical protein
MRLGPPHNSASRVNRCFFAFAIVHGHCDLFILLTCALASGRMRALCLVGCVWVVWLLVVVAGGHHTTEGSDAVKHRALPADATHQVTSSHVCTVNPLGTYQCVAPHAQVHGQQAEGPSNAPELSASGRHLTTTSTSSSSSSSSDGPARKLLQAGTTTLRPSSAPTRCLDTLGVYTFNNRLTLAVSCTGSVHQSLWLPVAGQDLTMAFLGDTTTCLDVAFGGTTSGTSAGVSAGGHWGHGGGGGLQSTLVFVSNTCMSIRWSLAQQSCFWVWKKYSSIEPRMGACPSL